MKYILSLLATLCFASHAFAADPPAEGPCKEIVDACEKAGFVKGQWKEGSGLWVDCIDPIMRGTAQPKKADKPLPTVPANLIAACKAKHPNFGQQQGKGQKPANAH